MMILVVWSFRSSGLLSFVQFASDPSILLLLIIIIWRRCSSITILLTCFMKCLWAGMLFILFFFLAGWSMFSVCWVLRVIMNKVGSLLLSFCLLKVMWADVLVWAVSLCVWYLFAYQPCVLEICLHIMISNEDVFLFTSWIDRSWCITGTVPLGGQRGSHLRYASLWILAWCSGA